MGEGGLHQSAPFIKYLSTEVARW